MSAARTLRSRRERDGSEAVLSRDDEPVAWLACRPWVEGQWLVAVPIARFGSSILLLTTGFQKPPGILGGSDHARAIDVGRSKDLT